MYVMNLIHNVECKIGGAQDPLCRYQLENDLLLLMDELTRK